MPAKSCWSSGRGGWSALSRRAHGGAFTTATEQLPARARCTTRLRTALLGAVIDSGRAVARSCPRLWTGVVDGADHGQRRRSVVAKHRRAARPQVGDRRAPLPPGPLIPRRDRGGARVEPWMSIIINTDCGSVSQRSRNASVLHHSSAAGKFHVLPSGGVRHLDAPWLRGRRDSAELRFATARRQPPRPRPTNIRTPLNSAAEVANDRSRNETRRHARKPIVYGTEKPVTNRRCQGVSTERGW
jgi:hypothetical protein